MAEPSLDRLSRFTPDAGSLDRDALLFAAGRSSARPNRGWMALATFLLVTQSASLALLRPHPARHPGALPSPVAGAAAPRAPTEAAAPEESRGFASWATRHRLRASDAEDRSDDDVTLIDSGPPLRAFPRPPSLLN